MGLHLSRRGYSVRVDEMLVRDSSFVIRAEITYDARLWEEERARLSEMAQLDLLLGLEGAEVRGRQVLDERRTHGKVSRRAGLIGRGGQPGLAVRPAE